MFYLICISTEWEREGERKIIICTYTDDKYNWKEKQILIIIIVIKKFLWKVFEFFYCLVF